MKAIHYATAFALVALGATVSVINYSVSSTAAARFESQHFDDVSSTIARSNIEVFKNVQRDTEALAGGLSRTADDMFVDEEVMTGFSEKLLEETGSDLIGILTKVYEDEISEFEKVQTERWNEVLGTNETYTIKSIPPPDDVEHKGFVVPVSWMIPYNPGAILLDIHSEPKRREALTKIFERQVGVAVATAPIELVQDKENPQQSCLVFSKISDRHVISNVVRFNSALLETTTVPPNYKIELLDSERNTLLHVRGGHTENSDVYMRSETFEFASRKYELVVTSPVVNSGLPGTLASTVFAFMVFLVIAIFYIVFIVQEGRKELKLQSTLEDRYNAWMEYMNHSIRTPLHSINFLVDVLIKMEESDGKTDRSRLEMIRAKCAQLYDLVNSYVDFSAINTGQVQILERETDVCGVVRDVFYQYKIVCNPSISMYLKLHPTVKNLHMYIDPVRLRQIMGEAIGNAQKYTEKGRIDIIVKLSMDRQEVLFIVTDTGRGLVESASIGRFSRGADAAVPVDPRQATSGLGLVIARELAIKMHGNVRLSPRGDGRKGAEFVLELPFNPLSEEETSNSSPGQTSSTDFSHTGVVVDFHPDQRLAKIKVAACEDDYQCRCHLRDMLVYCGVQKENILLYPDGKDLLDEDPTVDVYLLDIVMQYVNGYKVAKKLREAGHTEPLVASTGNTTKRSLDEYRKCGFNRVLQKPYTVEKLRGCLVQLLVFESPPIRAPEETIVSEEGVDEGRPSSAKRDLWAM